MQCAIDLLVGGIVETKEHWIQHITFTAETNAACTHGWADTDTHTDAEQHNTFSVC